VRPTYSGDVLTVRTDRYDLDLLTELLLGAVTEAAQHVASTPAPTRAAHLYGARLRTLITSVVDTDASPQKAPPTTEGSAVLPAHGAGDRVSYPVLDDVPIGLTATAHAG
jgi:hypothetical protein